MAASLNGLPLVDPHWLKRDCDARGVPTHDWWGLVNLFTVPLLHHAGRRYGYGSVLMTPSDYAKLPTANDSLTLVFRDSDGNSFTLSPLTLVGLPRVLPGADTDYGSVYRVDLADRRYRLAQVSVGRSYNTLADDGTYVAASLNGGTPWTWAGILSDIWGLMLAVASDLAAVPSFPSAPAGTPQGFYFEDDDAWAAACRVVEAAGYLLRFDPTADRADIVDPATASLAMAQDERKNLLWDTGAKAGAFQPPWPESLQVSSPRLGRLVRHQEVVAVAEGTNSVPGTTATALDDLPAVGDPVLNGAALAARAAAVLGVWEWDFLARHTPVVREFAGCCDWVRRALGTRTWAAWAVGDRSQGPNGGLISSAAGFAQRDDRFGVGGGGGGSSPCAGAGQSVNLLTNQCDDGYGGTTNEYVTLTVSASGCVSVGPKWCEAAPACCPVPPATVTSPCCPGVDLPQTLYATISGRGTYPLVYTGSYWRINANWPDCAGPDGVTNGDWILYLQCADTDANFVGDTWQLVWNGGSKYADAVSCDPLRLTFLDCNMMATGGPCAATLYDVVIEL